MTNCWQQFSQIESSDTIRVLLGTQLHAKIRHIYSAVKAADSELTGGRTDKSGFIDFGV